MGLAPEVFLIRDYVPAVSISPAPASRAAGTYFIIDNGKMLGSWRANKGGENDFIRNSGIKPGRYMILPKAEDGKRYKKGQPAVTGLAPGLKPGQPNNSYPPGSALIHGPGPTAGCITVPPEAEAMTRDLMNQNSGKLRLQIENGESNRAVPVTNAQGNFMTHKATGFSAAEVLAANRSGYIAINGATGGGTSWGQQTSGGFVDAPGSNINLTGDNSPEMPMSIMTAPR
jgi:hypothetical protein